MDETRAVSFSLNKEVREEDNYGVEEDEEIRCTVTCTKSMHTSFTVLGSVI